MLVKFHVIWTTWYLQKEQALTTDPGQVSLDKKAQKEEENDSQDGLV